MKIFVSYTCYDLVDLRAELLEDLRQYGIEAHFSDAKNSAFVVPTAPTVNSLEACLASLRECDLVIFILSQRYGPPLGEPFGNLAATHCEYNEAKRTGKAILFYVRNDLWGDYSAWKRNGRPAEFNPSWALKKDAAGLFALIEDHVRLVGEDGNADSNNWRVTFSTSVDLRSDIRRRLRPQVVQATADRMIERGEVPFLVVTSVDAQRINSAAEGKTGVRYCVYVANVGPMVAFDVSAYLKFASAHTTPATGTLSVLMPSTAGDLYRQCFVFDLTEAESAKLLTFNSDLPSSLWCRVYMTYHTPAGFSLVEMAQVDLGEQNGLFKPRGQPKHCGKHFHGPLAMIRHG